MPTRYTEFIENGKITTGADFLMLCARAIDVLGEMRDEPLDAPIPQKLNGDSYYKVLCDKAYLELEKLRSMSTDDIHNANEEDYQNRLRNRRDSIESQTALLKRYDKVLEEVMVWEPPTNDHVGLKNFAINQIRMCTRGITRCLLYYEETPVERMPDDEWYKREVERCEHDVKRYEKNAQEEAKRDEFNYRWLRALRQSLGK